jgi:hypothetical protein
MSQSNESINQSIVSSIQIIVHCKQSFILYGRFIDLRLIAAPILYCTEATFALRWGALHRTNILDLEKNRKSAKIHIPQLAHAIIFNNFLHFADKSMSFLEERSNIKQKNHSFKFFFYSTTYYR